MTKYILPVVILFLIIYGFCKKVPVYGSFADGAREACKLVLGIFPYITAIFILVALFRASGLSVLFAQWVGPVFEFLGIPSELAEIMFIRPMSGNGSIALLEQIYTDFGADSYIARCASVIVGSSETIFYITAVYFSTTKVKKLRYAVPVSLFACLGGAIIGCLLCRFL